MFNLHKLVGFKIFYVKVFNDRMVLRLVEPEANSRPALPERSIKLDKPVVSDVKSAAESLKKAIAAFHSWWELLAPNIVIQAAEMVGSELTEQERVALSEMAELAGAMQVFLILEKYRDPTDEEVRELLGIRLGGRKPKFIPRAGGA